MFQITQISNQRIIMLAHILQAIYQSEHHMELKFHEIMSSKCAKKSILLNHLISMSCFLLKKK